MRHLNKGRKLKRTSSHRKALLNNLATALFEHKKILTTEAKAKELRPFAEQLITRAKHAYQNERAKQLPEGHSIDIHNRRIVNRYIKRKAVLQELFDSIAPAIVERPGGYCRIIKVGNRRGDGGRTAIIELVDWSNPVDAANSIKKRKKQKEDPTVKPKTAPNVVKEEIIEKVEEKVETAPEEKIEKVDSQVEEVLEEKVEELNIEVAEEPIADAQNETNEASSEATDNDEEEDVKVIEEPEASKEEASAEEEKPAPEENKENE